MLCRMDRRLIRPRYSMTYLRTTEIKEEEKRKEGKSFECN